MIKFFKIKDIKIKIQVMILENNFKIIIIMKIYLKTILIKNVIIWFKINIKINKNHNIKMI